MRHPAQQVLDYIDEECLGDLDEGERLEWWSAKRDEFGTSAIRLLINGEYDRVKEFARESYNSRKS